MTVHTLLNRLMFNVYLQKKSYVDQKIRIQMKESFKCSTVSLSIGMTVHLVLRLLLCLHLQRFTSLDLEF